MPRRPRRTLAPLLCAPLLLTTTSAHAGDDPTVNFNVVVTPADFTNGCTSAAWIDSSDCQDLSGAPVDGPAFLWVVVSSSDGFTDGVSAAQFGVEHDLGAPAWMRCTGGLEVPSATWPASGSGTAVTWDSCYVAPGSAARIGYFILDDGDTGQFAITPDPRDGSLVVADCDNVVHAACPGNAASVDLSVGTTPVCTQHDVVLSAPENLTAAPDGCDVSIEWTHDGVDVSRFFVERDGNPVGMVGAEARVFVDDTVPTDGGTFAYTVVASADCGGSTASAPAMVTVTRTPPPSDCVASDGLCDVEISWIDNSSDELGFELLRNGLLIATLPANETTFVDSLYGTAEGNLYSVRAIGPCGDTDPSNEDLGTIIEPPDAATLTASTTLCGVIALSWEHDDPSTIELQVRRDGALLATLPPGATTYDDDGATPGVFHEYEITALNTCGASASEPATGRAISELPGVPTALDATDGECGVVTVTWEESGTVDSVEIHRDDVLYETVAGGIESFDDHDVVADVLYTYHAIARNDCGVSGESGSDSGYSYVTAMPIDVVSLLTPLPDACAGNPVTFTWRAEPGASEYRFEILDQCLGSAIHVATTSDTAYSRSLPPGRPLVWRVRGEDACGAVGDWSECRDVRAYPLDPPDQLFVSQFDPYVEVYWNPVTYAESYRLYLNPIEADCHEIVPGTIELSVTGTDTLVIVEHPVGYTWLESVVCGEPGPPSYCDYPTPPIPVVLDYFRGTPGPAGVELSWRTRAEEGIAGFHVHRTTEGQPGERVTDTPVPSGAGSYAITDPDARPGRVNTYSLAEVDASGEEHVLAEIDVLVPEPARELRLSARPNPFNPRVTLRAELPSSGALRLDVLNAGGRVVTTLANGSYPGGAHTFVWEGRDHAGRRVAPGVYFARAVHDRGERTRRLVLLP